MTAQICVQISVVSGVVPPVESVKSSMYSPGYVYNRSNTKFSIHLLSKHWKRDDLYKLIKG